MEVVYNKRPKLVKGIEKSWTPIVLMSVLGILYLEIADQTSLFSFGYSLLLLTVSCFFLCRDNAKRLFFAYHFNLFFAISFYLIFKSQFPEYLGMSGAEGLVGTDDCRFYAQIVGGKGIFYRIMVSITDISPYSMLLKFIYPFEVFTPLNIVIVNLIFAAYLPIYVRRFAILLTDNEKIGNTAYWFSLLCPFNLYFSGIILRESFTAVLVIAGMCYYLEKKSFPLVVCAFFLIWVRFGTLAFLICGILMLYRFQLKRRTRTDFYFAIIFILVIVTFYFSFSFLQNYSSGKLEDGIIRSTNTTYYEGSTIGAIMRLPFPMNIILSSVFYLFIPFLSVPHEQYGHYLVSSIFQGLFTPVFMFFLWNYIFNASLQAITYKQRDAPKQLLFLILLFALLLGTISLQTRHKTVLFPIICILAAYGKEKYNKRLGDTSVFWAAVLIGFQLIFVVI